MQALIDQLGPIANLLWALLGALAILIVGYIIARVIASIVRRILNRVSIDNRLVAALDGEDPGFSIEDIIGKIVFWVLMLFVIVGALQFIGLTGIAAPLQALLDDVTTVYLPRVLGALVLLFIAWAVASILRLLVRKGADLLKIDERLTKHAALEEGERVSVSDSLATAVFWFVFLLFLPAILNALGIASIAEPMQQMFNSAFEYVPNIVSAALILLIGWFAARIVRQIVSNLLAAVGIDSFGERVGLQGARSLSNLVGLLLYTFILLVVLISALEALDIAAISVPAVAMLNQILSAIPAVLGAALVLVIAYFIGRLIANLVADLLKGIGFDSVPERLGLSWWRGESSLSEWVSYIVLVGVMLVAALSAVELLGSEFLSTIVAQLIAFAGQALLAIVILAVGLFIANLVRDIVYKAGGANASLLSNVARLAVLVLAIAMALRQLGVANDIVNLAFGLLLGAIAVAVALAFGLGSRETAGREVERIVSSLRGQEDATD